MKAILTSLLLLTVAFGISACVSPLRTFDALVPKDGGSRKAASGVAYAPGDRAKLDVYVPSNADGSDRPVIVWFYGGSWNSGTRKGYNFAGRALAARGYVVVVPDYRLVPEVRYPAFLEDGAAAVRWAKANAAQFGGDPEQMVLAGHSAGAYIAAMLANDTQWLGADRDLVKGWVGMAGPYDFLPLDTPATIEAFGQWPDPEATQPINFASAESPPALLLTGEDDTTVEPRHSDAIGDRLLAEGAEARVVKYPGVDHIDIVIALSRPLRGRAPVLADIAEFVAEVTERP